MSLLEAIRLGRERYAARMRFVVKLRAFQYSRYYKALTWDQSMIMAEMEMRYGTSRRNLFSTESEGKTGSLSLQATAQNGVYNG